MKLEWDVKDIKSSEDFNPKKFGIGNIAVVLEILRSKMYPNPIKSFTQELMSNARDAHREISKDDVPIVVNLPTRLDSNFYVRDFGPGISPDRMANVFILYCNSTKRDGNEQTGGFGIGAKSPWSYTDSFCIITNTPEEDGTMISRKYIAYVDESRTGALAKVDEEETTEAQGTTIIVACKPNDQSNFQEWVKKTTQNWPLRPIIKGVNDWEWEEKKYAFEGEGWTLKDRGNGGYYNSHRTVRAIIDGIPYKLNWDNLETDKLPQKAQEVCQNLRDYPLNLHFEVGELPVTANREEIDYTPKAIALIQKRMIALTQELVDIISKGITQAKNLWEANVMWNKSYNNFSSIIGSAKWKTHDISGTGADLRNSGIKIVRFSRHYGASDKFRKQTHYSNRFNVAEDTMLLINDEATVNPNRRRLKTIFEKYPDIQNVEILMYPDDPQKKIDAEKAAKDVHLDLYAPQNITAYDKAKIVRKTASGGVGKTVGYKVPVVWKFQNYGTSTRDSWDAEDVSTGASPKKGSGVYVLMLRRTSYWPDKDINTISIGFLSRARQVLGEDIYAISKRQKDKIGKDWIPLRVALQKKHDELVNDPKYVAMKHVRYSEYDLMDAAFYNISKAFKSASWKTKITDKKGKMYKYASLCEDAKAVIATLKQIKEANYCIQKTDDDSKKKYTNDLQKMAKGVKEAYPLLNLVNHYSFSLEDHGDHFYDYINMVDAQIAAKKAVTQKAAAPVVTVPAQKVAV